MVIIYPYDIYLYDTLNCAFYNVKKKQGTKDMQESAGFGKTNPSAFPGAEGGLDSGWLV